MPPPPRGLGLGRLTHLTGRPEVLYQDSIVELYRGPTISLAEVKTRRFDIIEHDSLPRPERTLTRYDFILADWL